MKENGPGQAMSIRRATVNDCEQIARIQVETWKESYAQIIDAEFLANFSVQQRTERWREILQRPQQESFVVEAATGKLVGFANGGPARDEDFNGAELYGLYVHPDSQRIGLGQDLVRRFVSEMEIQDYRSLLVWTLKENPARKFYERLGGVFHKEKTIEIGSQSLQEISYVWNNLGDVRFS